ncbi:MAG: sulfatase-like hydrolase/transferase [Victivallales bacterium]|nr:sulfatase-like hydrolase/transferase [Victivallales bacterium]
MINAPKPEMKPNIVVFFCDQLRIDLLSCYGGNKVRTPNIDALAANSTVFGRAYTPCALCSPARASLMTGLYPHSHHMFNNSTPGYSYCEHLKPEIAILPDWVKDETDYESAYFGKWHIGSAQDLFNSSFTHTHPRPDQDDLPYLNSSHWHPDLKIGPLDSSYASGQAGTIRVPMERFPDVAAANYTRRFIRGRKPDDKPFCAFCAFPGPHSPWLIPSEFGIRYDPKTIDMWKNRNDSFEGKPINQRKLYHLERHRCNPDEELRELLACLFSYMELIDTQVGAVLDELKSTGQYDNTLIVFTADHGDMAGSHGFLSKGAYMYDETYRIPLLVKTPGACKGRRIDKPVHLMDVTATLMHAMRGEPICRMATHDLQGDSLLPLLSGEDSWTRKIHYAEYHGDWYGHYSARMVTDARWKLVWNLTDFCELYDLERDPGELVNLFYSPGSRAIRQQYFQLMIDEARRLGDEQLALLDPGIEDFIHQ